MKEPTTPDDLSEEMLSNLFGYTVENYDPDSYIVARPDKQGYIVDMSERTCTCEDFRYRGAVRPCKHIRYLDLLLRAVKERQSD